MGYSRQQEGRSMNAPIRTKTPLAERITALMADGRERTVNDVALRLKISRKEAELALTHLTKRGELGSVLEAQAKTSRSGEKHDPHNPSPAPEGFPMFSSAVQRIATISLVAAPWEAGETMAERRAREASIRAKAEESERRAAEYAANRKPGRNGYCLAPGCTVALSKHTRGVSAARTATHTAFAGATSARTSEGTSSPPRGKKTGVCE